MERGFLKVDPYGWTGLSGLYAAGDVTGGLMLAHAASHQAVIAVDRMAGKIPPRLTLRTFLVLYTPTRKLFRLAFPDRKPAEKAFLSARESIPFWGTEDR